MTKILTETHGGLYIGNNLIVASERNWGYSNFVERGSNRYHISNAKSVSDGYLNTILLNSTNRSDNNLWISNLKICGCNDWFIPSINQLYSFIELKNKLPPKYKPSSETFICFSSTEDNKYNMFGRYWFNNALTSIKKHRENLVIPFRYMS